MKNKSSTSGLLYSLSVVVALMPLSFRFTGNGVLLLMETPFRHFVWIAQGIILLLFLLTKVDIGKNRLISLGMLFLLVPFTFTFDQNHVSFLILNQSPGSVFSWTIALVLFGRLFFRANVKKNINL